MVADSLQHAPAGCAGHAGAQQRVHHQRGVARLGGNLVRHRAAAHRQHPVIRRRVAAQIFGSGQQHYMERARMESREKLACDGQSVAAVVPLAAQHRDALPGERRATFRQKLHHAVGRILHEDDAGNPHFDGPPVHFAHFPGQRLSYAPRHH